MPCRLYSLGCARRRRVSCRMSNVFGKRRRLGGPTESPCVECADTTIKIRSHAVATSLACWRTTSSTLRDTVLPSKPSEWLTISAMFLHDASQFRQKRMSLLMPCQRQARRAARDRLCTHIRVPIEAFAKVHARAKLLGKSNELR